MRCLLTLLLFPVMLRADVPAQDLPPVRVKLENPATENGRNAWETPRFRTDADSGGSASGLRVCLSATVTSTVTSTVAHVQFQISQQ